MATEIRSTPQPVASHSGTRGVTGELIHGDGAPGFAAVEMTTNKAAAAMEREVTLSLLWTFVMFNMLCADILSFMNPGFLKELATGYAGNVHITQGFLFVAAIMLEIPIAMIFLSRVFPRRVNRIANIIAVIITIAFVVGGGSTAPHYLFFATMEILALLLVLRSALKWREG